MVGALTERHVRETWKKKRQDEAVASAIRVKGMFICMELISY